MMGGLSDTVARRVAETTQYLFDVAEPGSFGAEGRAIRSTQKIRLMHAAIRYRVLRDPSWDTDMCGVPISQLHLAATLTTFSSGVLEGLRKLGFDVSDEEDAGWRHLWRVTGGLLGIREELLTDSAAEEAKLFERLRTEFWQPSPQGRALARATVDFYRQMLPARFLDGYPPALIRHLAGDECADVLGLPPSDWTGQLVAGGTRLAGLVPVRARQAGAQRLMQHASFELMRSIATYIGKGRNTKFRIPDALLDR